MNTFIFLLKLFQQHTERHLDLNGKDLLQDSAVEMMVVHIDLLGEKVVMENIVDGMMVEKGPDLAEDLGEDVLLNKLT